MILNKRQSEIVNELTKLFKVWSFTNSQIIFDVQNANVALIHLSLEPFEMFIGDTKYTNEYTFLHDCRGLALSERVILSELVHDWITRDQLSFGALVQLTKSDAPQVLKDMAAMKLEEVANV